MRAKAGITFVRFTDITYFAFCGDCVLPDWYPFSMGSSLLDSLIYPTVGSKQRIEFLGIHIYVFVVPDLPIPIDDRQDMDKWHILRLCLPCCIVTQDWLLACTQSKHAVI